MRFSSKVLITKRGQGNVALSSDPESAGHAEEFLTARLVTAETGTLRDATFRLQATLWRSGGDGSFNDHSKGRVETLKLEQDCARFQQPM